MSLLLWLVFLAAFAGYKLTGRTFELGYRAMRRLHGASDGRFNDRCLRIAQVLRPPEVPRAASGFLGAWTSGDLDRVVAGLDRDGIALLDRTLPASTCEALEAFARATPALPLGRQAKELYDAQRASALRYDFDEADLLRSADVCTICFDGTFSAIAAAYFRCRPVYDFVTMWWTTPSGPKDYSAAAQKFHFDMDRLFFLKFFVYLTDVTADTGPHVFVAGSHRRKPPPLRQDRRFEDGEVTAHYPADAVRTVCGSRGTIFAADTRALHKGQPVVRGERLVLQVEFAISRFGQNYRNADVSWRRLQGYGFARMPDPRVFRNIRAD